MRRIVGTGAWQDSEFDSWFNTVSKITQHLLEETTQSANQYDRDILKATCWLWTEWRHLLTRLAFPRQLSAPRTAKAWWSQLRQCRVWKRLVGQELPWYKGCVVSRRGGLCFSPECNLLRNCGGRTGWRWCWSDRISQSVAPGSAASPGNLFETQILTFHSRPPKSGSGTKQSVF